MLSGLFKELSAYISDLDKKIYTKSSMIGISHAIEDIVIHFDLNAELYVFFQDYKFFHVERERYLKLDQLCRKVFIFAKNIRRDEVFDFNNTVFIELRSDSPFCDEWNVVVCHPKHSMVFSSSELYDLNFLAEDTLRKFTGFLSFSPAIANVAAAYINRILKDYGIDYEIQYLHLEKLTDVESDHMKKVSFFINRALDEIEQKSELILKKNVLLSSAVKENEELSLEILKRLCYAAEYRDDDAALHLIRMSFYSTALYSRIQTDKTKVKNMNYASLMHDIGKIGIPDTILFKPGALTKEEFEVMKTHCKIGADILSGSSRDLIRMAQEIALNHHEKWDGSGYPSRKSGLEISDAARVVAIADVFDALLSKRVYKDAYSIDRSVSILKEEKRKHFDPELVDLFLGDLDEFIRFRERIKGLSEEVSVKSLFSSYFGDFEELRQG